MSDLENQYLAGKFGGAAKSAPAPTPAYEDPEGLVYNGATYSDYQFALIKDLLSEGPIEGLVTGDYSYFGRVGDVGYTGVVFKLNSNVTSNDGSSRFLKSIRWNENPLVDSQDKFNFQQINVSYTKGGPYGTDDQTSDLGNSSYIRSIGERLRGPNSLAHSEEELTNFKRTYKIFNRECNKIDINFKISSLYLTLKYQDLTSQEAINGVVSRNATTNTFVLDTNGRPANPNGAQIYAGVGSVIDYGFDILIKWKPIFKEGIRFQDDINLATSQAQPVQSRSNLVYIAGANESSQLISINLKGKITQGYEKQVSLDLSAPFQALNQGESFLGWEIVLLKKTPETTTSSRVAFLSVDSITERYYSSFRYTNSAIVTTKFNAEYFSRIPDRAYDTRLLKIKVPSNYDPITKSYGNITTLPITITKDTNQSFNSSLYFSAVGSGYLNFYDFTPPITGGLIARFDATFATVGVGSTVTSWGNSGITTGINGISCIIGDGTYLSPQGANGPTKPTTALSYNGKTGVTFTSSQKMRFVDSSDGINQIGVNGNVSIFYVAKWEKNTPGDQKRILQGYKNANNNWLLGFGATGYTRKYNFDGGFLLGPDSGNGFNDYLASDFYGNTFENQTHIAGAVIRAQNDDIDLYWDNCNFTVTNGAQNINSTLPKGLGINYVFSNTPNEPSYCTLFELLVYNRDLSKGESDQVIRWLNKKWVSSATGLSYDTSVSGKLYSDRSLIVNNAEIKVPIRTIAANGENTVDVASHLKPYLNEIPERFYKNANDDWFISDQGFSSFYCDFWLKLDQNLASNTYNLVHRDGQFNLCINIDTVADVAKLILKIFGGNDTYTITKTLARPVSALKADFNRITAYVAPVIARVSLENDYNTLNEKIAYYNTLYNDRSNPHQTLYESKYINLAFQNINNTYILGATPATSNLYSMNINVNPKQLSPQYVYSNPHNAYKNVSINEETAPTNSISNSALNKDCTKLVSYSYESLPLPFRPKAAGFELVPLSIYDFFPDILNSKLDVLVNGTIEISARINIEDYNFYTNWVINSGNNLNLLNYGGAVINNLSPSSNSQEVSYVEFYSNRTFNSTLQHPDLVLTAITDYNQGLKNTDAYFSTNSANKSVNLPVGKSKATLGVTKDYIWNAANGSVFTPFGFINATGVLEVFSNRPSFGAKIQGLSDGLKIDDIPFDRNTLLRVKNRTLFADDEGITLITYAPSGVTGAALMTDLWDGTFKADKQWTDNPAWCFYDLLTNKRYGAGNYVPESNVDKWSLYQIGKYCDELVEDGYGGLEPRFTCNTYITSQDDALKVLNDMASVFRGMFYYANGYVYAINDMPASVPIYTFTNSNVVNGNFNYESTSIKDRNSSVYVRYVDKTNLYKPAVEYVENIESVRRYGQKEAELTAFACTSRGQAQRLGRWLLASEFLETDTVSFDTGPEAVYLKPGDVIKVYDYNKKYQTCGGRINSISFSGVVPTNLSGVTFALDRKLDFNFTGANALYKFSILSPNYNLDPSVNGAVTGSTNAVEFRKPLAISYNISSGSSITTGLNFDYVTITGLHSFLYTGINYTGLSAFTGGASGFSPQGIVWTLENINFLDGTSNNDYDYYRIFRIQEANDSHTYTIFGTQMMNLKYTQIDSGLALLPDTKRIDLPSSPESVLYCVESENLATNTYTVKLTIKYDQSIYENTIGFRVFIRNSSDYNNPTLPFDPNKDLKGSKYFTINLSQDNITPEFEVNIFDLSENTEYRIYGVDSLNRASLSYISAIPSPDPTCLLVDNFDNIYDPNKGAITVLTRLDQNILPLQAYNNNNAQKQLDIGLSYDFIKDAAISYKPENDPNSKYYYRLVFLPVLCTNKQQFKAAYDIYKNNTSFLFRPDPRKNNTYLYSNTAPNIKGKFRNFSVGIDVIIGTSSTARSSSKDFQIGPDGDGKFKLITYNNLDNSLLDECQGLINDVSNKIEMTLDNNNNKALHVSIDFRNYDPFIDKYILLMTPTSITDFSFANYVITNGAAGGWVLQSKSALGTNIANCHFVFLSNKQQTLDKTLNVDAFGNPFNLLDYNGWLIVDDLIVNAKSTTPHVMNYVNYFIDSSLNISAQYPINAQTKEIQVPPVQGDGRTLYNVIKTAGTDYLHWVFNSTSVVEIRFGDTLGLPTRFINAANPNDPLEKTIVFSNIVYRPAKDSNLAQSEVDPLIFKERNLGNFTAGNKQDTQLYQLSQFNINNSQGVSSKTRDYKFNGNKVFIGQVEGFPADLFFNAILGGEVNKLLPKDNYSRFGQTVNCDICIADLNTHFSNSSFSSPTDFPTSTDPALDENLKAKSAYNAYLDSIANSNGYNMNSAFLSPELFGEVGQPAPYSTYLKSIFDSNVADIEHLTLNTQNCNSYISSPSFVDFIGNEYPYFQAINESSNFGVNYSEYDKDLGNLNEVNKKLAPKSLNIADSINQDQYRLYNLASLPYVSSVKIMNSVIQFSNILKPFFIYVYVFTDDGVYQVRKGPIPISSNGTTVDLGEIANSIAENGITPHNYFVYTENYANPVNLNKALKTTLGSIPYIYEIKEPRAFKRSYLIPILEQGFLAKNNFFIQSNEISIVVTFHEANDTNIP